MKKKNQKKLLNRIRNFFPVSRKEFKLVIGKMMLVLDGFTVADKQHTQIENSVIKSLEQLKQMLYEQPVDDKTDENENPSYQ